jgi:hypothetical protein
MTSINSNARRYFALNFYAPAKGAGGLGKESCAPLARSALMKFN